MTLEIGRNPLGEFLSPSLVICPRIVFERPDRQPTIVLRSQMILFTRSQSPKRIAQLTSLGITPESVGIDNWYQLINGRSVPKGIISSHQEASINEQNEKIDHYFGAHARSKDWLPPRLVESYQNRLRYIEDTLMESGVSLPPATERLTWKTEKKHKVARYFIRRLFPQLTNPKLKGVLSERSLFRGKKVEQYVDEVALPNAIGFWDWMLAQLPPEIRQPLELSNSVRSATSILDLIDIYTKSYKSDRSPRTGIDRDEWEAGIMLSLIYMATIADLARNPKEDDILAAFNQAIAGKDKRDRFNFPEENESWHLKMNRDTQTGECIHVHFANPVDNTKLDNAGANYEINQSVSVHRYNNNPMDVFIFPKSRTKELYSRMFKMWRGRPYPLTDLLGARFVVYLPQNIPGLIKALQGRLTDWDIREEDDKSTSPASALTKGTKYVCSLKKYPECKIELQIETALGYYGKGSFIRLQHNPNTNPKAFRVKQLLEMLPIILPEELYGIKWIDEKGEINPELFRILMKHANLSLFE